MTTTRLANCNKTVKCQKLIDFSHLHIPATAGDTFEKPFNAKTICQTTFYTMTIKKDYNNNNFNLANDHRASIKTTNTTPTKTSHKLYLYIKRHAVPDGVPKTVKNDSRKRRSRQKQCKRSLGAHSESHQWIFQFLVATASAPRKRSYVYAKPN